MPITREAGFLHWPDASPCPSLGIETDRLTACLGKIQADGIKSVFGSPCFGFAGQDLDFLKDILFIEAVCPVPHVAGLTKLKHAFVQTAVLSS